MKWVTLLAAAATFAALAAARFIESASWIHALTVALGGVGLTGALTVGLVLRSLTKDWALALGLLLSVAATLSRTILLQKILGQAVAFSPIDVSNIFWAASSVIWALLALGWCVHALARIRSEESGNILRMLGCSVGITLALYALTPLWHLLGLSIDHWTSIGLIGLALLAYGVELIYLRFRATP